MYLRTALTAVTVAVATQTAPAGITAMAGAMTEVSTPPSLVIESFTSATELRVFREGSLSLAADVTVDIDAPGTYTDPIGATETIPAGTRVEVYFLHHDQPGVALTQNSGSITFDADVIGIIAAPALLDATDAALGVPTTTYPTGQNGRGTVVGESSDTLTLSGDRRTITWDSSVASFPDQMRVLLQRSRVAGTGGDLVEIPAPSSVLIDEQTDDTAIQFFREKSVTLPSNVAVNITLPGTYSNPLSGSSQIPAGTSVDVYFFHHDQAGDATTEHSATITFDTEIEGIIVSGNFLNPTDATLGLAGTAYPTGQQNRGTIVNEAFDTLTLSSDRRTISWDTSVSLLPDQMRVLLRQSAAGMTGAMVEVAPPPSVENEAFTSSTEIRFFEERTTNLPVDLNVDNGPGFIPAGTRVRSVFVHHDAPGTDTTTNSGSITFDADVLGIIGLASALDASDPVLGLATTSYPTGLATRGTFYTEAQDSLTLSGDLRTITLVSQVGTGPDQMRVLLTEPACPWDCGDNDGTVGIVDFLALLAGWGTVDTPCDFDSGGVGITDFLALLAGWGACP